MRRPAVRFRSRLLATALLWCVAQGWVAAPLADAVLRHDPSASHACPTQGHLERPTSPHGDAACLLPLAHAPTMGSATAPAVLRWLAEQSGPIAATSTTRPDRPAAHLPPSRAPPARA
jgi:hypothetical protein